MTQADKDRSNWKHTTEKIAELMAPIPMYSAADTSAPLTLDTLDVHRDFTQHHVCYDAAGLCPVTFSWAPNSMVHVGGRLTRITHLSAVQQPAPLAEWSFNCHTVTPQEFVNTFLTKFHAAILCRLQESLVIPEAALLALGRRMLHQPSEFFGFECRDNGRVHLLHANPCLQLLRLQYPLEFPVWDAPDAQRAHKIAGLDKPVAEWKLFDHAIGQPENSTAGRIAYELLCNRAWWPQFVPLRPLHAHAEAYTQSHHGAAGTARETERVLVLAQLYQAAITSILTANTDVLRCSAVTASTTLTEETGDTD